MRILPLLLIVSLFLVACTANEQEKINQENIAVIEKYIQAVQAKDTQTMTDLLADNYIGYGPSVTDSQTKSRPLPAGRM